MAPGFSEHLKEKSETRAAGNGVPLTFQGIWTDRTATVSNEEGEQSRSVQDEVGVGRSRQQGDTADVLHFCRRHSSHTSTSGNWGHQRGTHTLHSAQRSFPSLPSHSAHTLSSSSWLYWTVSCFPYTLMHTEGFHKHHH